MDKSRHGQKKEVRAFIPIELWDMVRDSLSKDWRIKSLTHFVELALMEKVERVKEGGKNEGVEDVA
jgi:hypothetical protein